MIASGLFDAFPCFRRHSPFVHGPQEVHEVRSVAPERGVDLHVALASAAQLGYLLLAPPLCLGRLLLTIELFRLHAGQQALRQDGGQERAGDTDHRGGQSDESASHLPPPAG
ncbi:hypothetical protein ACIA9I_30730 [Streptomyces anulatus]